MTRSRGMRAAFVLRRMRYNRLLLACILAAILIITGLVTVLANFAARALPAAAAQQLASASTTILANSSPGQPRPGATDRLIASYVRGALGGVSFGMQRAVW